MIREQIYKEIEQERRISEEICKFDTAGDDDTAISEWCLWAEDRVDSANQHDQIIFRKYMLRLASLAVAAIEAIDRKLAQP